MDSLLMNRACIAGALALALCSVAAAEEKKPDWSYKDIKAWDEFPDCKSGNRQSPINLKAAAPQAVQRSIKFRSVGQGDSNAPPDLNFARDSVFPVKLHNNGNNLEIDNTEKVKVTDAARPFLYVGGQPYTLVNVHFHSPAEHFDPSVADMELHIVHSSGANRAVVAVGLKKGGGDNPALAPFFANVGSDTDPPGATIDLLKLIPPERNIRVQNFVDSLRPYYSYQGSLTTPTCDQNVTWYLFEDTLPISQGQIEAFNRRFQQIARPFQTYNPTTHKLFRCCNLLPPS